MSSIYANSSDSYWKERQKPGKNEKRSSLLIGGIVVVALIAVSGFVYQVRKSNSRAQTITQRRTLFQTTESDWRQCETEVNSRQECASICQQERNSIPKPTMHQSCLHGCQQAHVASVALGCRGKLDQGKSRNNPKTQVHLSEEDVFGEVGVLAYEHCSKYQGMDPKPDVFVTCRKYHRAGTKQGFRLGIASMNSALDEEWEQVKSEQ